MNEQAQDRIHAIRNTLVALKYNVHMHMAGDARFTAEKDIETVTQKLNEIWDICLKCPQGETDES